MSLNQACAKVFTIHCILNQCNATPDQLNKIPGKRNRYFISITKQNKHRRKQLYHDEIYREIAQLLPSVPFVLL